LAAAGAARPIADPDEIAQWIVLLLSPVACFMTGAVILLDGDRSSTASRPPPGTDFGLGLALRPTGVPYSQVRAEDRPVSGCSEERPRAVNLGGAADKSRGRVYQEFLDTHGDGSSAESIFTRAREIS
jgi:hypothetical protein